MGSFATGFLWGGIRGVIRDKLSVHRVGRLQTYLRYAAVTGLAAGVVNASTVIAYGAYAPTPLPLWASG